MAAKVVGQQQDGGDVYGLDRLRAAVIMLSVSQSYKLNLKDSERCQLCAALCLPQMTQDDFLNYWADFSQDVPFLRRYVFNSFFPARNDQKTVFLNYSRLCLVVCLCCSKN